MAPKISLKYFRLLRGPIKSDCPGPTTPKTGPSDYGASVM